VARIVVAGYLVRYPLGGYAWCAAHYLLGLRSLGHDMGFVPFVIGTCATLYVLTVLRVI
jgi:hypothetical protein